MADSQHAKEEPLAFYGSKTAVYYTEKYIELPNIEEFINEIIMEATIINEKGKAIVHRHEKNRLVIFIHH